MGFCFFIYCPNISIEVGEKSSDLNFQSGSDLDWDFRGPDKRV